MKSNMLILLIPSLIVFALLIVHMYKTRGKIFVLSFLASGLVFGLIRSRIIHFIQLDINHSKIPYVFGGGLLRLGDDSLVVILGWIITAYISWNIAEIIIDKHFTERSGEVLPTISLSFFIISAFAYLNETAASVAGWWNWNEMLTANLKDSLFINVPWVGLIDWATVSFEFLAVYIFTSLAIRKRKIRYLLVLTLPILHWLSHINVPGLVYTNNFLTLTPSLIVHFLLPILAIFMWFVKDPAPSINATTPEHSTLVWASLFIVIATCIFSEIYFDGRAILLISAVPIGIFILAALGPPRKIYLYCVGIAILLTTLLMPISLERKITTMSIYPILYFATIEIIALINPIKLKHQKLFFLSITFILISLVAYLGFGENFKWDYQSRATKVSNEVILITLDTVAANYMGSYGYKSQATPNFDKFAEENTLYENAYTPIPFTYPAHFSLFSGLYPFQSNRLVNSNKNIDPENNYSSLASLFSAKGFRTGAFVSSEVLMSDDIRNGFSYFGTGEIGKSLKDNGLLNNRRQAKEVIAEAQTWLSNNNNNNIFAWIHLYDAHSPYAEKCDIKKFSSELTPDNMGLINAEVETYYLQANSLSNNDFAYLEARYLDGLYCLDRDLGLLLEDLKARGIYENATIIIAGDHGENFDHSSLYHGENLYQTAIKIPLAIKTSIMEKKVSEPVSLLDVYPTLVNKFNLRRDEAKRSGTNLTKTIPRRDIFFQTTKDEPLIADVSDIKSNVISVLSNNLKLILNISSGKYELYDVAKDPLEKESKVEIDTFGRSLLQTKLDSTPFQK